MERKSTGYFSFENAKNRAADSVIAFFCGNIAVRLSSVVHLHELKLTGQLITEVGSACFLVAVSALFDRQSDRWPTGGIDDNGNIGPRPPYDYNSDD